MTGQVDNILKMFNGVWDVSTGVTQQVMKMKNIMYDVVESMIKKSAEFSSEMIVFDDNVGLDTNEISKKLEQ